MPTICRFRGISIKLYWREHNPPHFHAVHSGENASFEIQTLEPLDGKLPPPIQALVLEWAALYRQELLANWDRVQAHQKPARIAPLK